MSTDFETLLLEKDEKGVFILTINRPDKMNALNKQVLDELDEAINVVAEQDATALVVTGAGEKAFVAGADIKELSSLDPVSGEEVSRRGQAVFQKIENLNIPVIAAVNGYALGGGLELAMACHIRIASSEATLGLPEVSLGLIPGYGGTQRLAELTGKAKAMELIISGRFVKSDEALQIGLVNQVADGDLMDAVNKFLSSVLKQGPVAISKAIEAVKQSGKSDGFEQEAKLFGKLCGTEDFKEGTTAFLEKRKADFAGK